MARPFLEALRPRTAEMLEAVSRLVSLESPSADVTAVDGCIAELATLCAARLGSAPERIILEGRPHLLCRGGGATRVLLLGHIDTVWPLGTLSDWPFEVRDDRATGPGCFDDKAGIVQGIFAMAVIGDLDGVALLVTSDEELGSPTSRALIEDTARGASAVLVLEPAAGGALKIARKGVSGYEIEIEGRAAHAGLEPHKGANALVEMAQQVLALAEVANEETTVTPTLAQAGSAVNVVPARARVSVDVRVPTPEEQARVDAAMRSMRARVEGTRVLVRGGPNRPPLPEAASADLFARARRLATELGIGDLQGVAVGGGSDGNFTAGIGVPTLDGLGAVGDGAHARGEHILIDAMPERAALVAALIDDVRDR